MKTIYSLAVLLVMTLTVQAQFTDDIESYATGPVFNDIWTTWDGNDDGVQNAIVSTTQAASGTQSIFIGPSSGGQDAVLDFGSAAPAGSGLWNAHFMMYVPAGNSAYFNIQGNTIPNANANLEFMTGNIYFNQSNGSPGIGTDDNVNNPQTFSFPHDEWFLVGLEVDMSTSTYRMDINNGPAIIAVTFNQACAYFGGVDFFAAEAQTTYYIDDVSFDDGPLLGIEDSSENQFSVYPNPVKDVLNISSKAVVDSVVVYDILGKIVHSATPSKISPAINLSNLAPGSYLVNVTIGNTSKTIKIIK